MKIAGWVKHGEQWHSGGLCEGVNSPAGKALDIAERALKIVRKSRRLRYCPPETFPEVKELLADSDALLAECEEEKPEPTVRENIDGMYATENPLPFVTALRLIADEIDKLKAKS